MTSGGIPLRAARHRPRPRLPGPPRLPGSLRPPGPILRLRAPRPFRPLPSLLRPPTRLPRSRPNPTGRPTAAHPPGTRPWSSCCRFRRSRETRSRRTRRGGTQLKGGRRRRVRAPSGSPLRICPPTWRPPLSRSAHAAARSGSTSDGPGTAGISTARPASTPGRGSLVRRGRRFGSCPGGERSEMGDKDSRPPVH